MVFKTPLHRDGDALRMQPRLHYTRVCILNVLLISDVDASVDLFKGRRGGRGERLLKNSIAKSRNRTNVSLNIVSLIRFSMLHSHDDPKSLTLLLGMKDAVPT